MGQAGAIAGATPWGAILQGGGAVIGGIGSGIESGLQRREQKRQFDKAEEDNALERAMATSQFQQSEADKQRELGMGSLKMMLGNREQAVKDAQRRSARDTILNSSGPAPAASAMSA